MTYSRQVRYILFQLVVLVRRGFEESHGLRLRVHHSPSLSRAQLEGRDTSCLRVSPQNLCSLFIIMFSFDLPLHQRRANEKAHF